MLEYIEKFVLLNLNEYPNININFPIGIFLIAMSLAICIACFILNYDKMYSVIILKQLIRREATSEESAKTIKELNIDNSFFIKFLLKKESGRLASIVKKQGEVKMTYEEYMSKVKEKGYKKEKLDFSTAKFYIPAEQMDTAKMIVATDTSSHIKPILLTIMIIALMICIAVLFPSLLDYVNRILADK